MTTVLITFVDNVAENKNVLFAEYLDSGLTPFRTRK